MLRKEKSYSVKNIPNEGSNANLAPTEDSNSRFCSACVAP